jgi:hypothetical protein
VRHWQSFRWLVNQLVTIFSLEDLRNGWGKRGRKPPDAVSTLLSHYRQFEKCLLSLQTSGRAKTGEKSHCQGHETCSIVPGEAALQLSNTCAFCITHQSHIRVQTRGILKGTNSMEQIPSWEADSPSAGQELFSSFIELESLSSYSHGSATGVLIWLRFIN